MARLITALVLLASSATTAYGDDLVPEDGGPYIPIEEVADEPEPAPVVVEVSPVWDRLAACESSGIWSRNTGNGYYGGLQEDMTFWRNYGGPTYAPRPDLASKAAQISVAIRGQAVQGWGAWPRCSRMLGLR